MVWPDDYINKIICGDCLEVMQGIPDGAVDLVVTDPPYGIGLPTNYKSRGRGKWTNNKDFPAVHGDDKPFDPIPLLRQFGEIPLFIFGGNYFARQLPEMSSWYVWDKRDGCLVNDQADCELIWSNVGGPARVFRHLWNGCLKASERTEPRQHPTQKPIALMRWLIAAQSKEGQVVLDPYVGSGTTCIAAKQLGRKYIGIEINPDYCKIAEDRLRQGELFGGEKPLDKD